ncbi:MAG: DUF4012 domain-containing protein [Microgenomates group bacterium]|nr:DUF4012 domain-containing protein [Microgenomates group bacterium]
MRLKVEQDKSKQKLLIIDKNPNFVSNQLKIIFEKYDNQVFFSTKLPENLEMFNICFFINPSEKSLNLAFQKNYQRMVLIYLNEKEKNIFKILQKITKEKINRIKVIYINGDRHYCQQSLEKILWFSFSKSQEKFLQLKQLNKPSKKNIPSRQQKKLLNFIFHFNKKFFLLFFLLFILIGHLFFLLPLTLSYYHLYQGGKNFLQNNISLTETNLNRSQNLYDLSRKFYSVSRPTFLLFSLALFPDSALQINEKGIIVLRHFIMLNENGQQILKLILKKDKTPNEKESLKIRFSQVKNELDFLAKEIIFLNQKLPNWPQIKELKNKLTIANDLLNKANQLFPYLDQVMAKNDEKKYLLLFANNMELRPGGGFIGSFGIVIFKDNTFYDLKIYDVYDADGQLIAHIRPPDPIKNYLKQPHWFLRDSAFSGDFLENYSQAKFFLDKELGIVDLSGAVLITTTAVNNILEAFGNLYLPDFRENVNKDNFYLKAQYYSEKNFFAGSLQKKNFLSSVARAALVNFENVSLKKLFLGLKKSLDEKQIVIYLDQPNLQKIIDSYYWSGRIIQPTCPPNLINCLPDYIFPLDANLGVNKANFFITRLIETTIKIDSQGNFHNIILIKFKNNSPNEVFPGGYYRNYFQLLLPKDSFVKKITKNDTLVEDFDEENSQFKKIGFFFELAPLKSAEIKIEYQPPFIINKGRNIYQLLVQKQIGSSNNDFILKVSLPKNIYLVNQNFSPLVKDNQINYNTTLSADKIFFIELMKE